MTQVLWENDISKLKMGSQKVQQLDPLFPIKLWK